MRTLLDRGGPHVGSAACFIDHAPRQTGSRAAWCASLVSAAVTLSLAAGSAVAADICVFTDHAHPIRAQSGTRVIELDAPARLLAPLSAKLPADPQRASELVSARLKAGGAALQRDFAAAYQGVIDAWRLGIAKVPAVVVDRRYVVYGEPDLARALSWIENYRSAHP